MGSFVRKEESLPCSQVSPQHTAKRTQTLKTKLDLTQRELPLRIPSEALSRCEGTAKAIGDDNGSEGIVNEPQRT